MNLVAPTYLGFGGHCKSDFTGSKQLLRNSEAGRESGLQRGWMAGRHGIACDSPGLLFSLCFQSKSPRRLTWRYGRAVQRRLRSARTFGARPPATATSITARSSLRQGRPHTCCQDCRCNQALCCTCADSHHALITLDRAYFNPSLKRSDCALS